MPQVPCFTATLRSKTPLSRICPEFAVWARVGCIIDGDNAMPGETLSEILRRIVAIDFACGDTGREVLTGAKLGIQRTLVVKVFITGGAGFIGSHLAERLLSEGHSVSVLDDLSTGLESNLDVPKQHGDRFSFTKGSVLDADAVQPLVDEADVVFHLAAAVGVHLILEQPSKSILTNVAGTERVLEACLKDNTRAFIASTSEVYGKSSKFPQSEGDDLTMGPTSNIRWSYACAKMLDEFLALAFVQEHDLPVTILRFFNTTGPRQTSRYGMVIPSFVDAALRGDPLKVHGSGEQSRCFCHVHDVIEALVRLLDAPAAAGAVMNIGTNREVTIRDLADKVVELSGSASQVELVPYEEVYAAGFEDMQRRKPDISRLHDAIGFRPETPLEKIIEDLIEERKSRAQ